MEVLDEHGNYGKLVRFTNSEWEAIELFAEGLEDDEEGADE